MRRPPPHIAERIHRVCPAMEIGPCLRSSLKCRLIAGTIDSAAVVAKVLDHDDPVWAWYLEREARVYRSLPTQAPAPRLHSAHEDEGVLILERAAGHALAPGRRLARPLDEATLCSILSAIDRLTPWDTSAIDLRPPPDDVVADLRRRLLEDPTASERWFHRGIDRCEQLGILEASSAHQMREALRAAPQLAPSHGDLLPRNVMAHGTQVTLVDWECAGLHLRDWDRALLWASLPAPQRHLIEDRVSDDAIRRRAFLSLAAFALAREIKFAARSPRLRAQLQADLHDTTARLAT